ncbi:MAG: hypothetical protein U5N55_08560 [Cypionkella sp.]|nr:hypothetical protein [Cypionkella sp.]
MSTLGLTIPVFVISMMLILVFAVWLNWLPASGWGKPERWILPITAYAADADGDLRPLHPLGRCSTR